MTIMDAKEMGMDDSWRRMLGRMVSDDLSAIDVVLTEKENPSSGQYQAACVSRSRRQTQYLGSRIIQSLDHIR